MYLLRFVLALNYNELCSIKFANQLYAEAHQQVYSVT